ncbi:MAG: hypothetical protein R6X16_17425 [Anaerolineae bacterium]
MKGTDRFLIAVVVGSLVLVVALMALVLARSGPDAYLTEDTPEAVIQNYVLACQRDDTARAYGTLSSDLPGYPANLNAYERNLRSRYRSRADTSVVLTVLSSSTLGNREFLRVRETVYSTAGPFGQSEYTNEYTITLRRHTDGWKILAVEGVQGYPIALCWMACWQAAEGCR